MIIHIWMHWFWITTFFSGSLFLAVQMISFACIPHLPLAEAGLLINETFTLNNSSQTENPPNITSLSTEINTRDDQIYSSETTSYRPFTVSSSLEPDSETDVSNTDLKTEVFFKVSTESTADLEDTYNGGNIDTFQYPLKKFTKYSRIKYGKVKGKGKTSEESEVEGRHVEEVKLVEEKLNINFSIDGLETDVDKINDTEGNVSGIPEEIMLSTANSSAEINETETTNASFVSFATEVPVNDEPSKTEASASVSSSTEEQSNMILKNDTLVIENKVEESGSYTTVEPFVAKNRVAAATSAQNQGIEESGLNAGSITGITLGILVLFTLFGAVSFVLYRRRYLNKPQVLNDKCSNLDSSGYIDDTSLRENSEEMYSLDNDSFLNSLEAMTIQNYWTESVKHTKL